MRPLFPALAAFRTARAAVPLALLLAAPALGQERAATERRLEALRTQIQGVEQQIGQAQREEEGALAALEGLQTEIQLREQLVEGYRSQLADYRTETGTLRGSIQRLEGEIEEARASYLRYARHAYVRGQTQSDLALILSAGSIPQMIARARYLRQFTDRRRRQVARIEDKTAELRGRERDLQRSLQYTQQLLTTSQFEQTELAERRRQRETLAQQARQRRSRLESELAQRRADAAALEGLVRDLVAAERRREEEARRAAEAEAARRRAEEARAAARAAATPEATAGAAAPTPSAPAARAEPPPPAVDRPVSLAGTFRANRGRLPWPAEGTVTGTFGTRTDPVYGTRIDAPGIDITTAPGAGVRAVFDGTVEAINVMPTFGTFVMVSHGGYHTFYANLSSVGVRQGQRVRAGQVLGRAGTAEQSRGTGLFFAIFEGERQVNPLPWLRGR